MMARGKSRVPAGTVKVTVNLNARLVRRAKIRAIVRRLTFGALVEQSLKRALRERAGAA